MAYATVTLTGTYLQFDGTPAAGSVTIIPSVRQVVDDAGDVVLTGRKRVTLDAAGSFSVDLPATDDDALNPTDFGYTLSANLKSTRLPAVSFQLPAATPAVDISDLTLVDPATFSPTLSYPSQEEVDALEALVATKADDAATATALATKAAVADVTTETAAREAADASLASDLSDETTARLAETTARIAADAILDGTKVARADAASWPIYVYGNSYGVLSGAWFTTGNHWTELLAERLNAGAVTSYAQSARRIHHTIFSLLSGTMYTYHGTAVAGSAWPGVSSRSGLVVIDSPHNDIGHYPSMNVSPVVPAVITSANTRYLDSMKACYRTVLALASHESKHEQGSGTFGGTWANQAIASTGASGGTVAYTTTVGAYWEKSVTPPQTGPMAGKVFIVVFTLDPAVGVMAQVTTTVDGGTATNYTPPGWESYTGVGGTAVQTAVDVVAVTVPIDGAAHTVRITHAGSAGQFMYVDCLLISSEEPNPILVGGAERAPVVHAGVFDQAGVNAWRYNAPKVTAKIKDAVAEFPHALYVTSTMTASGLSSADGIHPNDVGMDQRAYDAEAAIQATPSLVARLRNRAVA